ncbi:MAG: hypothetical protein ACLUOI_09635 [Eisenbergiella sp.]
MGLRGVAQVLCGGRDIYFNKLGKWKTAILWGTYKLGGDSGADYPYCPVRGSSLGDDRKTVLGRQIQAVEIT